MFTSGQYPSATLPPEWLGGLNEQILDANRAAAKLFLEVYEQTLESIVSYQEQAASQTDVDWIAAAAAAQAQFTRELAKHQVSVGRELLK
jgi:hypothetical protein